MVEQKKWLSMRHFITREYCDDIYMGQQHCSICNTNIRTNGLIEQLKDCIIFASPLERSKQTVEYIINTFTNINFKIIYLDGLIERGLGDFEGKYKEDIRNDPKYFLNKRFIVTKTPPNGESILDFRSRVENSTKILLEEAKQSDILVVSHLQTLRMIRFCVMENYNYNLWYNINYMHGEVVQESYGKERK